MVSNRKERLAKSRIAFNTFFVDLLKPWSSFEVPFGLTFPDYLARKTDQAYLQRRDLVSVQITRLDLGKTQTSDSSHSYPWKALETETSCGTRCLTRCKYRTSVLGVM